jgi:hypothetical protein
MGGDMPQEWNSTYICPTYKNGDKKDRNNYTGINITNSVGRKLSMVLKNKIKNMIQAKISEEQVRLTAGVLLR